MLDVSAGQQLRDWCYNSGSDGGGCAWIARLEWAPPRPPQVWMSTAPSCGMGEEDLSPKVVRSSSGDAGTVRAVSWFSIMGQTSYSAFGPIALSVRVSLRRNPRYPYILIY